MALAINPYKEVKIKVGGSDWWVVFGGSNPDSYFIQDMSSKFHLYLDKDIEFSVSSKYKNVLEELSNKFKNSTPGKIMGVVQKFSDALAGVESGSSSKTSTEKTAEANKAKNKLRLLTPNVRYQTKLQNLPSWESTEPLDIGSFKFHFHLGMADVWDARTEVYNPALALTKVNQPVQESGRLRGPLPSTAYVYGAIGGALAQAATREAQDQVNVEKNKKDNASEDSLSIRYEKALDGYVANLEQQLYNQITSYPGTGLVQITVGRFELPIMYVERTSAVFSTDTDQFGFPIWADVTWSGCKTLEIATTKQMPLIGEEKGLTSLIGDYEESSTGTGKDTTDYEVSLSDLGKWQSTKVST